MKPSILILSLLLLGPDLMREARAADPEPPPPVVPGRMIPERPLPAVENQRLYGPGAAEQVLIAREVASRLMEDFRAAYGAPSAPRLVIYINRPLVSAPAASAAGDEDSDAVPLSDRQTTREIERLFGRVFRNAGARLADQEVATALLPESPGLSLASDQAARERAALRAVADVAIEVLISSRDLSVPAVSGDRTVAVPDIQVTAIRLEDAAIVGQASAADIIGSNASAGELARRFSVQDITEATALALMEDMLISAP